MIVIVCILIGRQVFTGDKTQQDQECKEDQCSSQLAQVEKKTYANSALRKGHSASIVAKMSAGKAKKSPTHPQDDEDALSTSAGSSSDTDETEDTAKMRVLIPAVSKDVFLKYRGADMS